MRFAEAAAGIVIVLATAAGAAAPFDGTYVGTSEIFTGTTGSGKGNVCATAPAPAVLTISNGHAQTKWGDGTLSGDVDANGKLVMHSSASGRFEGQIDASGALKGYYQGYHIYTLAWQRKG
jgi:hypothetical protein